MVAQRDDIGAGGEEILRLIWVSPTPETFSPLTTVKSTPWTF